MKISRTTAAAILTGSALLGTFAIAGTAFAATPTMPTHGQFSRPAVVGTVTSASGDMIEVASKSWTKGDPSGSASTSSTSYNVDATNATVTKAGAASSVSAIAVGDTIVVQGTVSGTNVTATKINDGVMPGMKGGMRGGPGGMHNASSTPLITGNGQPVVGGSVTAVSGSTISITNASNVSYTIDASAATITKPGITGATITNVAVGDQIVAQGSVNGSAVTATSVIDQGVKPSATSGSTTAHKPIGGFLGGLGGFFTKLFGFF